MLKDTFSTQEYEGPDEFDSDDVCVLSIVDLVPVSLVSSASERLGANRAVRYSVKSTVRISIVFSLSRDQT